jgi:phospholipase/carboxylesterase
VHPDHAGVGIGRGLDLDGVEQVGHDITRARGLAGIVALSTYLIGEPLLAQEASSANRDVPIFMAHGTHDPVVQYPWGLASRRALEAAGWRVEWHEYPMEHSAVLEELVAAGAFVGRVLAAPAA